MILISDDFRGTSIDWARQRGVLDSVMKIIRKTKGKTSIKIQTLECVAFECFNIFTEKRQKVKKDLPKKEESKEKAKTHEKDKVEKRAKTTQNKPKLTENDKIKSTSGFQSKLESLQRANHESQQRFKLESNQKQQNNPKSSEQSKATTKSEVKTHDSEDNASDDVISKSVENESGSTKEPVLSSLCSKMTLKGHSRQVFDFRIVNQIGFPKNFTVIDYSNPKSLQELCQKVF